MQSFNITEGLEAQDYTWRNTVPRKMTGVATGESETLAFTGSVVAMKSMAEQHLALGSGAMQVTCTVTRAEANMARLEVTRTWYTAEEEEEEEGGSGTPQAGTVGSSESNPSISYEYSEVQLPILTHPLVVAEGLADASAEMIALRMWANGADWSQPFVYATSSNAADNEITTVGAALGGVSSKVVSLVGRQQFYLDVCITCRVQYEIDGSSAAPDMGQIPRIEDPPASPTLAGGRNWLFVGGGCSIEGDRVLVTKNYKASDPGGWNPDSYQ